MTYSKAKIFTERQQELARIAKAFSHPARVAIIEYLIEKNVCISGDITGEIPLSRTTVTQHLQELKNLGLIKGEVKGKNVNYCICREKAAQIKQLLSKIISKLDIQFNETC